MISHLFHLHALSALHVGVGQAIGIVDLPIARERASNLPFAPGSSIKGVLRDRCTDTMSESDVSALFGPQKIEGSSDAHAGAIAVGDARLLLLPVRSLAGVMAWATCGFVLRRYKADLALAGIVADLPEIPPVASGKAQVSDNSLLKVGNDKLVIDDLDLSVEGTKASPWAKHLRAQLFPGDSDAALQFDPRLVILSDDDFAFLAETGTEVRARIRINDKTGTVDRGALWYEENLPAETVLWGVIGVGPSRKGDRRDAQAMSDLFGAVLAKPLPLQLGGKATVGRGLVRLSVSGG